MKARDGHTVQPCVKAMPLDKGEKGSAKRPARASARAVKGQTGTPFSQCIKAASKLEEEAAEDETVEQTAA